MGVYRLFRHKPFEPEAITMMSDAYTDICGALGLAECDVPATDVVAKAVIEFAQRGVNSRLHLRESVLAELTGDCDRIPDRVKVTPTITPSAAS